MFGLSAPDWNLIKQYPKLYQLFSPATKIRLTLAHSIAVPPRGVNFAITAEMYRKIGSMPQPIDEDGLPLPGEDVALKQLIQQVNGKITTIEAIIITSQRRVLQAIMKNTPNNYYHNNTDELCGDAELLQIVSKLDIQVLEKFIEATYQRFFIEYIVQSYKTTLWNRAWQFVTPQEDTFMADISTMEPDDLFLKYRELFLDNATRIYESKYQTD